MNLYALQICHSRITLKRHPEQAGSWLVARSILDNVLTSYARSNSTRVPDAWHPDVNGLTWQKRDRAAIESPRDITSCIQCYIHRHSVSPTWDASRIATWIDKCVTRARKITKRRFMVPRRRHPLSRRFYL